MSGSRNQGSASARVRKVHENLPDPTHPMESEAAPGGEGREKTGSRLRSPFLLQAPRPQQANFEGRTVFIIPLG